MQSLNEIITNWYPVLFLISAGVALTVWVWAIKRRTRLDIDQATKLILKRRYQNGQMFKDGHDKQESNHHHQS